MNTEAEWRGSVLALGLEQNTAQASSQSNRVNLTDRQKLVSLVFAVAFLPGEGKTFFFFPDMFNIIFTFDSASFPVPVLEPECEGARLELWARRGSFSFCFEHWKSSWLFKLPGVSAILFLCFHCSGHVLKGSEKCKH